ncbi:MAG: hypothetical protein MUO77_21265 [Anaerolineales bacterium]|nr:hypothetical protein [Anaerolineales bacterium]
MPRRDSFKHLRENPQAPISIIPQAEDDASERARNEARKKAVRAAYDKAHPVSAYYVPPALREKAMDIHAAVTGLAQVNMSTASSVSSALVSHALFLVRKGELKIEGRPNARHRKMVVHIEMISGGGWGQEIPKASRKLEEKLDPFYFGYRWSKDIQTQVSALAGTALLTGEVVVCLLERALNDLRSGKIKFITEPVETRQEVMVQA